MQDCTIKISKETLDLLKKCKKISKVPIKHIVDRAVKIQVAGIVTANKRRAYEYDS